MDIQQRCLGLRWRVGVIARDTDINDDLTGLSEKYTREDAKKNSRTLSRRI
jgi:hypothetical protein